MVNYGGGLIGIIALVCAIWVIYDVWTNNKKLSSGAKIVWTIFAVLFNIITAIVYYFIGKKK
ncbi:MAG: PLDc N-terminal domain-containing protein [Candidatus Nanoarchaeia archaeon]|nr:PLDc N-terminal domain-containing protein [Candidatus Nanoarchaeia archaeon]